MICTLPRFLYSSVGIPVGHVVSARAWIILHHSLSLVRSRRVVGVVVVARNAVTSVNHGVVLVASWVLHHVGAHLWVTVALHLPQGVLGVD